MKKIVLILAQTLISLSTFAQTASDPNPGGVTEKPLVWLKANAGATPSSGSGTLSNWVNYGNNGVVTIDGVPNFSSTGHNFNPTIHFNGDNDFLSITGADFTALFVVAALEDLSRYATHINTFDQVTENAHTNGNLHGNESNVSAKIHEQSYAPEFSGSNVWRFDGTSIGYDGAYTGNHDIISAVGSGDIHANRLLGGQVSSASFNGRVRDWLGDVSEYIMFAGSISLADRHKIESYLAIKYGKTLGINGTALDYNSTTGTSIWDVSANTGFNYDIAGISRDDLTGQDQRKSKSVNQISGADRSILTIANGTNFNTPIKPISDLTHFMWGNNNGATNFRTVSPFSTVNGLGIGAVLDRHWKSQETGTPGPLTLYFDMAPVTNIVDWSQLALLVDADGDFTTGATSLAPSAVSSSGILSVAFEHDFSNSEGFFFTLARTTITDLQINNPLPVVTCDSFMLPTITGFNLVNPQYYSDTSGTGTVLPVGTSILKDSLIYLFDETGGPSNQFDQDTLYININYSNTGIYTVSTCDRYLFNGITYTSNNNTAKDTLTNAAGCDSIITLDLTINYSNTGTHPAIACDRYLFNDSTYTSNNNTAKDTLTNVAGCDSIITLDLTIINSNTGIETVSTCDSYLFNGITYTTNNNTAKDTLTNAAGCDSIITLDLTINNSNRGAQTFVECDGFSVTVGTNVYTATGIYTVVLTNAAGCDSIVTLDLTIINPSTVRDIQKGCGSFTWKNGDGITYYKNNTTATHTIPSGAANGCDSIIELDLTIFPPVSISLGEDQYICDDAVLLSPGANFKTYLWSDNSNDSTLLASEPGVYRVIVSDNNNCRDSSTTELIKKCPENLWVPNAFTPNGDEKNDVFKPIGENIESYTLKIFNRWGNLLFETNSIDIGWDGTFNSKFSTSGEYIFLINYSYFEKRNILNKTVKGSFSLLK